MMKHVLLLSILTLSFLLFGCGGPLAGGDRVDEKGTASGSTPGTADDIDSAQQTLISFFNALARDDFGEAAEYHMVPNPLMFLYPDIDPQNAEDLLERACDEHDRAGCVFYCWKIKDIVRRSQASSDEFYFTVRFEDEDGNLLIGGDNVTPRVCDPPGCMHSEYSYEVRKNEGRFYVDGIPVFSGCWPRGPKVG
jgi:hypothetical protein